MPFTDSSMNKAFLLIGGNMGDRIKLLHEAKLKIEARCGTIRTASSVYETAAWGIEDQAPFLNQALQLSTALAAYPLLHSLLAIEQSLGRKREKKFGPRLIDIDILLFNNEIINTEELVVPHPELANRRFALQCLAQIGGSQIHPVLHKSMLQLLEECTDPLEVHKI